MNEGTSHRVWVPPMAYPHKSRKIAETIAGWFANGRFRPGDRFPSDQELAQEFGVNHVTVRSALRQFVDAGVLERRVGAGTIVRDPRAQAGARTQTGSVGLALPDATHSFFSELLRGAEEALLGSARPLVFGHTWELGAREEQVVANWLGQGIEHMILTPPVTETRFYAGLLAKGVRVVFVDRRVTGVDVPSIVSRDELGMAAIVQHLVARGHRRLVHLAGPASIWTAQVRRQAFERAARAEGLSPGDFTVQLAGGFYSEDGYRATEALLAAGPLPSAIVAANDPVAVGAVRALQERGHRVPEEIIVTGYGDTDLARNFGFPTVRQFPERMGREAVRLVLAATRPTASDSIDLVPELVLPDANVGGPGRANRVAVAG
jgi:LacI family transcriptional regulator